MWLLSYTFTTILEESENALGMHTLLNHTLHSVSLSQVNFMDEFPDELLTQAELQAVVQMAPECSPWKDKIERGQKAMKEHGCMLQKIVREEKAAIDAYNDKKKISCERDCKISKPSEQCVPGSYVY